MKFKDFGPHPQSGRQIKSMQPSHSFSAGTYVTQVTATDADDPTYGNSARVVYSILHGQPYFSVDPKTGDVLTRSRPTASHLSLSHPLHLIQICKYSIRRRLADTLSIPGSILQKPEIIYCLGTLCIWLTHPERSVLVLKT